MGNQRTIFLEDISQADLLSILKEETTAEILEEAVLCCALILEKLVYTEHETGFPEIDSIDKDEYSEKEIKDGLLNLLQRNIIQKGQIIWALGKSCDKDLKNLYIDLLRESFEKMVQANDVLFQTIIALDNIDERVIKSGSMGLPDIQQNYESVKKYLFKEE